MKKPTPKTVIALLQTDVAMCKARIAELEGHVCPTPIRNPDDLANSSLLEIVKNPFPPKAKEFWRIIVLTLLVNLCISIYYLNLSEKSIESKTESAEQRAQLLKPWPHVNLNSYEIYLATAPIIGSDWSMTTERHNKMVHLTKRISYASENGQCAKVDHLAHELKELLQ
jgi:hypothetical protein